MICDFFVRAPTRGPNQKTGSQLRSAALNKNIYFFLPDAPFKSAWRPPRLKEHIPSGKTRTVYAYWKQSFRSPKGLGAGPGSLLGPGPRRARVPAGPGSPLAPGPLPGPGPPLGPGHPHWAWVHRRTQVPYILVASDGMFRICIKYTCCTWWNVLDMPLIYLLYLMLGMCSFNLGGLQADLEGGSGRKK